MSLHCKQVLGQKDKVELLFSPNLHTFKVCTGAFEGPLVLLLPELFLKYVGELRVRRLMKSSCRQDAVVQFLQHPARSNGMAVID